MLFLSHSSRKQVAGNRPAGPKAKCLAGHLLMVGHPVFVFLSSTSLRERVTAGPPSNAVRKKRDLPSRILGGGQEFWGFQKAFLQARV
jgi:hypothetical protein